MATLNVVFARAVERTAQIIAGIPSKAEAITTSGTSQASVNAAGNEDCAQLTVTGGNVWVKFAAAPTAAAGSDYLLIDGQTREFGHLPAGTKVAAVDA